MYADNPMAKQNFEIGFLLNRASFALARYLNYSFGRHGLKDFSASYLGVLQCLWIKDGQKLSELAQQIGLEASSMTGLIDRMERAKLVKRQSDPADRRVWRIHLTEKGQGIQRKIAGLFEEAHERLTRGIPLGELSVVRKSLGKFIENSGYLKGTQPRVAAPRR